MEKELLLKAKQEIISLRKVNEKMAIRIEAIDDMLAVLHGKPGVKPSGGASIDICWEIDQALKELSK